MQKDLTGPLDAGTGCVRISVIIPALNEEKVIGRCLESLQRLDYDLNEFEVIVVDNGSEDGTVDAARTCAGELILVTLTREQGRVTELRNLGAASARGEFLAFLDADCLVPRQWLRSAVERLSTEGAGLVGGHCGIPENSSWVPRIWYSDRQFRKQGAVSYLPGANLLISRANFQMIGGFDESLETNEDCELCERARRNGLSVVAYPELGVVHLRDPQTLWAFYRKQAWQGKHVFKVFLRNLPSVVNIRPVFFALFTLCTLGGATVSFLLGKLTWTGMWVGLLLLPSVLLSLRVVRRRGRWKDFPPLVILHFAYGAGRASALLDLRNWWGNSKTSERLRTHKSSLESSGIKDSSVQKN